VNSDGTWGVMSRAFSYDAAEPIITGLAPFSGPPTTSVVIEGENFDSRMQNMTVQFNGLPARVVSSTSKSVTAIVPFGVTTGPVSVSVFGKTVNGPVFTVTAAAATTNLAVATFNFIDASVGSGGTVLTFTNDDDAVASATLPFNFSLFRDIYLAGSPISITTNGFVSLENLSAAEFENGPLPGQTVPRPSGGNGTIPPSLIAPFWDDLVMKNDSAVTTKTVGEAPNRQFVVQWSNMSILDENGRDQNASLTFEAVLFEGSNDIQFLYRNMNGSRANGLSATIGAQDLRRTQAIQKGFNQPIISSGYLTTYRFNDGTYAEVIPDLTASTKPVVTDEGTLTADKTQLAASWIADDPESGIREFLYAIGTTPGGSDVKPFTSTKQNSVVVTGLNLQSSAAYYFAVKAINVAGLVSEAGVSDGIRYQATFQPQIKIIPLAPENGTEFTGLAFLAPAAMSVVLRAYDANGNMILGSGIRNPATLSLSAGQQYAKQISELFGLKSFDGWIQAEASAPGLGIFVATGARDLSTLDGSVIRETSSDFVLFHQGGSAIFVNPSSRAANVTMTAFGTNAIETFSIPSKGRVVKTLSMPVRVKSSEALAAVERVNGGFNSASKLSINAAVPATDSQTALVFPHAVAGAGYESTLTIANPSATQQVLNLRFGAAATQIIVQPNSFAAVSIAKILGLPGGTLFTGAVSLTVAPGSESTGVVAVMDIENDKGLVTMGARPAATEFVFPHVANGNGLFTGLAFAAGSNSGTVTIYVYPPNGGTPKSGTVTLGASQQLGRQISELVSGVETQVGGYIRVRSDNPIWAWEIYGSEDVMASGPPL
jgi:hypothetical protein